MIYHGSGSFSTICDKAAEAEVIAATINLYCPPERRLPSSSFAFLPVFLVIKNNAAKLNIIIARRAGPKTNLYPLPDIAAAIPNTNI